MRKIAFLLMTIAVFGLTACSGKDGRDGRDGVDGEDGSGAYWFTKTVTINEADWVLEGTEPNSYDSRYSAKVAIPELSQWVYDKGAVLAYISYDGNRKIGLPSVEHFGEADEDGKDYLYTTTTDFIFNKGEVTFYVTYSDFMTGFVSPETTTFHVVLLWD